MARHFVSSRLEITSHDGELHVHQMPTICSVFENAPPSTTRTHFCTTFPTEWEVLCWFYLGINSNSGIQSPFQTEKSATQSSSSCRIGFAFLVSGYSVSASLHHLFGHTWVIPGSMDSRTSVGFILASPAQISVYHEMATSQSTWVEDGLPKTCQAIQFSPVFTTAVFATASNIFQLGSGPKSGCFDPGLPAFKTPQPLGCMAWTMLRGQLFLFHGIRFSDLRAVLTFLPRHTIDIMSIHGPVDITEKPSRPADSCIPRKNAVMCNDLEMLSFL